MTLMLALVIVALALIAVSYRYPSILVRGLVRVVRWVFGFTRRTIDVDGEQWVYLEAGESRQSTILLVHGFAADKDSWLVYARLLKGRYRIVIPDLPGFGEASRTQDRDYTPRAQAARLKQFCNALGIDTCHIVGSSMGGYISAWFAIDFDATTRSLLLMNAAGVLGEHASTVQTEAEAGANPLVADSMQALNRLLPLLAYRRQFIPGVVKRHLLSEYRRHLSLLDGIFWQLVTASQHDGLVDALADLSAPTLVVWGEHDQIIDVSCAQVFAAKITGASVLILREVGHIPMFEAPRETARATLSLIAAA